MAKYAKSLKDNPVDIDIVPVNEVNSSSAEYRPKLNAEETVMYFTSRRAVGSNSKKDDNGENPSNDNANAVEPAKATELNAGNVDAAAEATVKSDATTDAPTNTIVSDETPVLGVEGSEIKSDENVENNTHTV